MAKDKTTSNKMTITPQGGFPIKFTYPQTCGQQLTGSVGIETWDIARERYYAGCVMTHKDVDDLIKYLQHKQKRWLKS